MTSVCAFIDQDVHSTNERLRTKFQHELDEVHQQLPHYITALPASPSLGPKEWLIPALGGCDCNSCNNPSSKGANLPPTVATHCYYVDCFITPPEGDVCYVDEPIQIRLVGRDVNDVHSKWPIVRFLSPLISHLGIDKNDGVVKQDIIDLYAEDEEEKLNESENENEPENDDQKVVQEFLPSIKNVLNIVHKMLVCRPPEHIFGPSFDPSTGSFNQVHYLWGQNAQLNQKTFETKNKFRAICPHPALVDPQLAPETLKDFVTKSKHWPDGILCGGLYDALTDENGVNLHVLLESGLLLEESSGVYSFDLFTEDFCEKLIETLESFDESGLPHSRPNSMNRYGTIINNVGMAEFMNSVQRNITRGLASIIWPELPASQSFGSTNNLGGGGDVNSNINTNNVTNVIRESSWLDTHHSFSIRYKANEDLGLDMHTDDSEVTMNICLGKPGFEGAGLVFCGALGEANHRLFKHRYSHKIGRCIIHLGRQRHGADNITFGERINLVMWSRSLAYRRFRERNQPPYEREEAPPSLQCLSFTHDRDYEQYTTAPEVLQTTAQARNAEEGVNITVPPRAKPQGWCPPPGKEYEPPAWPAPNKMHKAEGVLN